MRLRPRHLAPALASLAAVWPLQAQRTSAPRAPRGGGIPGNELVVVATDFAFQAPPQVDAGLVNIRLFNRGTEMHHVLVIKVDLAWTGCRRCRRVASDRYMNADAHR
ncbi:MAG: hypothetical protein U0163_20700 [Gemmatimonadaceae bacterium]